VGFLLHGGSTPLQRLKLGPVQPYGMIKAHAKPYRGYYTPKLYIKKLKIARAPAFHPTLKRSGLSRREIVNSGYN
jgi:hypothetical protein